MIDYHNPEADVGIEQVAYDLTINMRGDEQVSLGLLANGFPDSEAFLSALGTALREQAPGIELKPFNKGNATIAAGAELLAAVTSECSAVVAAYGH